MDLLLFLFRSSSRTVFAMVIASTLCGVLSAILITIIHRALTDSGSNVGLIVTGFVAVALTKIVTQFVAQVMLVHFAQGVILKLCRNLCERVLAAPFDKLETIGSARLFAVLNDDVATLSAAVQNVPTLATNLAVLFGCSAYLIWLSWPVFVMSALMVVIGIVGYRSLLMRAHVAIRAARDGRDRLFGNFRTLIDGIKELKLHDARREAFVQKEIDETTELLRRQNIAATHRYMIADAWSQLLFFALVAVLLFGAPTMMASVSRETMTGYVFATLYMMTPIWAVIGSVPTFMRGRVSLAKIRELDIMLEAPNKEMDKHAEAPFKQLEQKVKIEFDQVAYTYSTREGGDLGFSLGPIDLDLAGGEMVFVTGGNGSGKSTLVKLLTGLYVPQSGQILLNGCAVNDASREHYRQHISAVFSDFHLFNQLFGLNAPTRDTEIKRYLALLNMTRKVQVRDGHFSTTALSSGQRKRLALLTAYLEDRPICVFDEWAADQDPEYKEVFYKQLLPDLRARGKVVIVITHDDRYFQLGDRILKLEDGKIIGR